MVDINLFRLAELSATERATLLRRSESDLTPFIDRVRPIIGAVRAEGDEALARFARHFDCVEVRQTFWDGALTADDAARWIDAVADSSASPRTT